MCRLSTLRKSSPSENSHRPKIAHKGDNSSHLIIIAFGQFFSANQNYARVPTSHIPAPEKKNTPPVAKETLELYVAGVLKGLLAFDNATAHSYTELLVRYRTSFHNYSVGMHYGSNLFKYLDRHWINTNHCETGVSPKEGVSVAVWCCWLSRGIVTYATYPECDCLLSRLSR